MALNRIAETGLPALLLFVIALTGPASAQPPAPQGVPSRLIGIARSGNFVGAVLSDSAGVQSFYRLQEELPDGSRIVAVENDNIRVKRTDGAVYELFIAHDMQTSALPVADRPVPPASIAPPAAPLARHPRGAYPGQLNVNRRAPVQRVKPLANRGDGSEQ